MSDLDDQVSLGIDYLVELCIGYMCLLIGVFIYSVLFVPKSHPAVCVCVCAFFFFFFFPKMRGEGDIFSCAAAALYGYVAFQTRQYSGSSL